MSIRIFATVSPARCRRPRACALLLVCSLLIAPPAARAGEFVGCIEDDFGGALGCTEGDVRIAQLDVLEVFDGCTGPSDTATLALSSILTITANTRYDIGFYLATDGGAARSGDCFKEYLPPPLKTPANTDPTAAELTSSVGPYFNAGNDLDVCGDGRAATGSIHRLLSTDTDNAEPETIVLPCTDVDASGFVDVGYCTGWAGGGGNNCTGIDDAGLPSPSSKCNCQRIDVGVGFTRIPAPAVDLLDFGDAPDSYGTLQASNGPRHSGEAGAVYLGSCIDVEANGLPNATATGDDGDAGVVAAGTCSGGNDENGVSFPSSMRVGQAATVRVVASSPCRLNAFIDWNADGSFAQAGDALFAAAGQLLSAGVNDLAFTVPAGATAGATFARFRCSSAGSLGPLGAAADGEVEDYAVTIAKAPGSLTVAKTAMRAGGTCGVDDVADYLEVFVGESVEYCYRVTAAGPSSSFENVHDVTLVDDMGTPADPADDQTISLSGLTNIGGNAAIGDLAAGATATGKSSPVPF